jgi:hypothetical protein
MSAQPQDQRRSPIRRRAALATGVITALAIAAPGAQASAAASPALPASAIAGLRAPVSSVEHPVGRAAVAVGPTIIGSVFNGGTAVVTSPGPAVGSVVGSPDGGGSPSDD